MLTTKKICQQNNTDTLSYYVKCIIFSCVIFLPSIQGTHLFFTRRKSTLPYIGGVGEGTTCIPKILTLASWVQPTSLSLPVSVQPDQIRVNRLFSAWSHPLKYDP
jgi:hypothetical protein